MTNGYIVLTKGDDKLYQHAVEAINLGKPIYFVDAENKTIYFGNTIALSGSDVVITAGNSTVTIESDNDVIITTSEVIANPELVGDEALLNGLQVGDTKYAMPHLYRINFGVNVVNNTHSIDTYVVGEILTPIKPTITDDEYDSLLNILRENQYTSDYECASVRGGDNIISFYVYQDDTYINAYLSSDDSREVVKADSSILSITVKQLF